MGLGHDDSIVYVREPKEIEYDARNKPYKDRRVDTVYIGFCGKIYPAFVINVSQDEKTITSVCYTIEEVDKFVHTYMEKKDVELYETVEKLTRWNRYRFRYDFSGNMFQPWSRKSMAVGLEKLKADAPGYTNFIKLFTEHNSPIFVVDPPANKIHVNCLLKPWEFYKVFDSYTAFQEISMYVGGILLAPVNPVPIPDDETLRDIKGFNKYSFRKEPKEK
jgi:hypothetical protein